MTSRSPRQQVQQNYAAGVGATYYLLFDVSSLTNTPQSYVMFQASQYDNYSYLFYRPTFISLDTSWTPSAPITIAGLRLGENGQELPVDQAYIPLNVTIDAKDYAVAVASCSRRSARSSRCRTVRARISSS